MARMLSKDAKDVLSCLPKEPLACSAPELAEDLFGHTDTRSTGRVLTALAQLKQYLFIDHHNTRPHGGKTHYGIRVEKWEEVKGMFSHLR